MNFYKQVSAVFKSTKEASMRTHLVDILLQLPLAVLCDKCIQVLALVGAEGGHGWSVEDVGVGPMRGTGRDEGCGSQRLARCQFDASRMHGGLNKTKPY